MTGGRLSGKIDYKIILVISLVWLGICDSLFFKTNGWSRLGLSLVAYCGLLLLYLLSGLKVREIGLAKNRLKVGFLLGLKIIAVYSILLLIAFFVGGSLFKDPRYHHSILTALYAAFFILPFKTILFEEIAFRGFIPALIEKWKGRSAAIWLSSALFGLWHMTTALGTKSEFTSHGVTIPGFAILILVFLATSIAGYVLVYLRYKSDSLATPLLLHWFINASAVILAAVSWSH